MSEPGRRLAAFGLLQLLQEIDDNSIERAAVANAASINAGILLRMFCDARHGIPGREWVRVRNSQTWFFDYALKDFFRDCATWKALFRIPHSVFSDVLELIAPHITASVTNFRAPLRSELKLAAFLMYSGGASCEAVATQLGIGTSTVNCAVKDVSVAICSKLFGQISFPVAIQEVAHVMRGFQNIRGLPCCLGAVDGSHIRWLSCPEEQYYEYRGYKGYPSIGIFAVATANRKFTFVDVGRPGVLSDSTVYSYSDLKRNIDDGKWLGDSIPDLMVAGVPVRPYLIGDCAFTLSTNMLKSSSQAEMRANPVLRIWDSAASQTRKPIDCAFGILKHRFQLLKVG